MKAPYKSLFFILKLGLTLGFFALMASWVDLSSVWTKIQKINLLWLLAAWVCVIFGYILSGIRWAWIAKGLGIDVSRRRKIKLYFLGMFASLFLPSVIGGDVIRGILLAKKKGRSGMGIKAGASVILDRLNGLYTLVLLITFCLLFFSWPWSWWLMWFVLLTGMWAFMLAFFLLHQPVIKWLPKKLERLAELPLRDKRFTRMWWRSMALSTVLLLFLIQAHVLLGIAVGLQLSWAAYVVMVGLVAVATVLPVSLNGFGIREAGYVGFAVYFGSDADAAAAMAALWVVVMGLAATPGAWVLWRLGGISSLQQKESD